MQSTYDLVIRNGFVLDGSGEQGKEVDVAISGNRIVEVGKVRGSGSDEIDALGKIVTPGFIDLHTHLDGHVTWESCLQPVTGHGVTTAVIGNCGFGFAPCKPADRNEYIHLMEMVEDISVADLSAGLPWNWESFPQYLDALAERQFNMDVAALLPHSTVRAYVMGERSIGEVANDDELAKISELVSSATRAGALGFGTSTLQDQKTGDGRHIPSYFADEREFTAIATAMRDAGGGVLQVAPEFNKFPLACDQMRMFAKVGKASGQPILFSLKQTNGTPEGWRDLLELSDRANEQGIAMHPQVLGRPTGAILGLQTSMNPFSRCPSYAPIATLPLSEKLAAMRTPEVRQKLMAEAEQQQQRLPERLRGYRFIFPLNDPPDYEPGEEMSIEAIAAARGISSVDLAYDMLLEKDGTQMLLLAGGNYAQYSLDPSLAMMRNQHSVPGLGDGGAHAGIICDASISTYMLSYWTRDRTRGEQMELPQVIKWMTADCAHAVGLTDRGEIAPGMKADINVIDHGRLSLGAPRPVHDLPAGGVRLVQDARGYEATIVSGQIVHRDDRPTDCLSGRLVRRSRLAA